jgi:type IV pilus assembly protein PilQ
MLSDRGKIEVDERGNQLIIRDKADNVAQIRELLRRMDRPNRQVNIEARFVEANSSFARRLGIQWGTNVDASATTGFPTGWFFPNDIGISGGIVPRTSGATSGGVPATFYAPEQQSLLVDLGASNPVGSIAFALGSISGLVDVDARLSAIAAEGEAKIVSTPRIQALDNEEAVVTQGSRIPYQSASQNGTNVQFINAALELRVTPHITSDNMIFLDIDLSNDRPDFAISVQGNPGISTKSIQTKVMVADGDTTVLGGVYATTEQFLTNRVPGLGNIPILGYLFKNSERNRTQNEMLVFITPHVVAIDEGETTASVK